MMHEVSEPLRRAVIDFLLRQQARTQPQASDRVMADRLGVSTSAWSQMRRGDRGLGIEMLCRAIKAYPGLLAVVVSFLGTLVNGTHSESAETHIRERGGPGDARERARVG